MAYLPSDLFQLQNDYTSPDQCSIICANCVLYLIHAIYNNYWLFLFYWSGNQLIQVFTATKWEISDLKPSVWLPGPRYPTTEQTTTPLSLKVNKERNSTITFGENCILERFESTYYFPHVNIKLFITIYALELKMGDTDLVRIYVGQSEFLAVSSCRLMLSRACCIA